MKRKGTLLELEESEETRTVKKRKSRSKRTVNLNLETDVSKQNQELQVSLENELQPVGRNSRKRNKKVLIPNEEVDSSNVKSSLQPETSSPAENSQKKKRKTRGDINQNGDIGEDTKLLKISKTPSNILKIKKKNGLQSREASESPSDFQPLGQLLRKSETLKNFKNKSVKSEEIDLKSKEINKKKKAPGPLKTRHAMKGILASESKAIKNKDTEHTLAQNIVIKEEIDSMPLDTEHVEKMPRRKKHLQEVAPYETATHQESAKPDTLQRRPKKKVRIDETESLKVKKELAGTEVHFSVRELPAKIIKSKLNKSLTEEVKVSPLTVQILRKEKKSSRRVKMDKLEIKQEELEEDFIPKTEEIKIEDDYVENELNYETSNSEDSDLEVYYINKNAEKEAKRKDKLLTPKKYSILMPKEDQLILVQRIQDIIPEADTKSYIYRLQNLEWEKVAFKNYSLEECQKVWSQLFKKVRHYRLLVELTHDIKTAIELNDLQIMNPKASKSTNKKHPDMPKRPLTSYLLYYIRKRDQIAKDRPELDTPDLSKYISEKYQNLPLDKKQKYEHLAAKNREEYRRQMEEFYDKHPEMRKVVIKKTKEKKQKPPKRPDNPYRLFVQSELNREEIAEDDKAEFKEVCREKWRQMSDAKKLGWINLAEEHLQKYEDEFKEYMAIHPEYIPKPQPKPFLTREELNLKDKLAGKPKKPPGTAYGLFISLTLQSNEIVNIPPKERWIYTSTKWKAMTEEERDQYKQLLTQVHEQYAKDFKVYLESLPEDKRQVEILRNMPKKRKNAAADKASTSSTRNTKASTSKSQSPKRKSAASGTKLKTQNPTPPPRSAYKYFLEKYKGENPKEAWKSLNLVERESYEKELSVLKDKYIKEFEAFLKGLTKDELAAFCANRKVEYSSSDETDAESEHGDNEGSSDDSSHTSDSDESDEN